MGQATESKVECFALGTNSSVINKIDSESSSKTYSNLDECLNESLALLSVRGDCINKDYTNVVADLVPVTFGRLNLTKGKPKPTNIRILLDSGSTQTILCKHLAKKLKTRKEPTTKWTTMAGTVKTGESAKVEFSLPEFHPDKLIEWRVHLTEKLGSYDMIIGRDILSEMGIDIHFSTHTCTWGHSTIPMRSSSVKIEQSYLVQESGPMKQATTRLKKILDAKYEAADIPKLVQARKDLSE